MNVTKNFEFLSNKRGDENLHSCITSYTVYSLYYMHFHSIHVMRE